MKKIRDGVRMNKFFDKKLNSEDISEEKIVTFLTEKCLDDKNDMTINRRLALWLAQFGWYNCQKRTEKALEKKNADFRNSGLENFTSNMDKKEIPDIRKSWALFEHFTLPRYIADPDCRGHSYERARLGEDYPGGTKLYPIFATSIDDLADFGVGTALYFQTIRALAIITGVAGLINIYLIVKYSAESGMEINYDNMLFYGSAFCGKSNTQSVSIENFEGQCRPYYDHQVDPSIIYDDHFYYNKEKGTCQVVKNNCVPEFFSMGIVHYVTMLFLVIAMYFMFFIYQKKLEVRFDEEELTASDYTVQVKNPPKDALDPEEWRTFFSKFSEKFVHSCTIVINNDSLVKSLVRRRILMRQLKILLPPGVDLKGDKAEAFKSKIRKEVLPLNVKLGFSNNASSLLKQIFDVEKKIIKLSKDEKIDEVNHVFVTFETENSQRKALETLSHGYLEKSLNRKRMATMPKFKNILLEINEPTEPTAVRWHNLDESLSVRILQRICGTVFSLVLIGVGFGIVYFMNGTLKRKRNSSYAITFFNHIIPMFCRFANSYESFPKEGNSERSLYFRIAIARWVNTVLVYFVITPFVETIYGEESLVVLVSSLFLSEMIQNPLMVIFDPFNFYYKHIAGPRALSQAEMNSFFRGAKFSLAERYTSLTKILFLCFFYATILPASYLFCSITLCITYFLDKYLLFRRWGQAPASGPSVAKFSRDFFFSIALVIHMIMSAYWWSGFPFDNVSEYDGKYYTVNQDMLSDRKFPALPRFQTEMTQPKGIPEGWIGWMSASTKQEFIVRLTGISSVVLLCVFVSLVLFKKIILMFISLFSSTYEPQGKNQECDYSELSSSENSLYIPQVKGLGLGAFPVLACDISHIEPEYLNWADPDDTTNYDKHNLICDLRELGVDVDGGKQLFSIVKQWTHQ